MEKSVWENPVLAKWQVQIAIKLKGRTQDLTILLIVSFADKEEPKHSALCKIQQAAQ